MANTKTQKYCQAHIPYCLGTVSVACAVSSFKMVVSGALTFYCSVFPALNSPSLES